MIEVEQEQVKQDRLAESKYKAHQRYAMKHLFEKQFSMILDYISPTTQILEVGCGVGDFLLFCKRHGRDKVVGIDISERAVEIANKRLIQHGFSPGAITGDVYQLSKIKGGKTSFGSVVMRGVVHHLEIPELAFESIFKVLSPYGKLVIIEGNILSSYRKVALGLANFFNIEHEASQFPHLSPETIKKMLEKIGFQEITVRFIPGVFTPFAYLGFGNRQFWRTAEFLEEKIAYKIGQCFFGWWFLLRAVKRRH